MFTGDINILYNESYLLSWQKEYHSFNFFHDDTTANIRLSRWNIHFSKQVDSTRLFEHILIGVPIEEPEHLKHTLILGF